MIDYEQGTRKEGRKQKTELLYIYQYIYRGFLFNHSLLSGQDVDWGNKLNAKMIIFILLDFYVFTLIFSENYMI